MDERATRKAIAEDIMKRIEALLLMDSISEQQKLSILKALKEKLAK